MELNRINNKLTEILEKIDERQESCNIAKANFENLKDQKDLMLAFHSMEFEGSEASIKRHALASVGYKGYVDGLAEARTEYMKALAVKNSMDITISVLQTMGSNIRSELKLTPYAQG